jgi:ketosteroid isomerase-like protein
MLDTSCTTPELTSGGFARAINEGDVEGALSFWAEDAVIVSPDGVQTQGLTALRERFTQLIATGAQLEIVVSDEHIRSDHASASTAMTITLSSGAGRTVVAITGRVRYVMAASGLQIARDEILSLG